MASLTQWTWTWANTGREWRTGRSGMLRSMESQLDMTGTEQQSKILNNISWLCDSLYSQISLYLCVSFLSPLRVISLLEWMYMMYNLSIFFVFKINAQKDGTEAVEWSLLLTNKGAWDLTSDTSNVRVWLCSFWVLTLIILSAHFPDLNSNMFSVTVVDSTAIHLRGVWKSKCFPAGASGKETTCQGRRYEMQVWSLGGEDPLEEEKETHSSVLAWRSPWTEELGRVQSTVSQRVGHEWSNLASTHGD